MINVSLLVPQNCVLLNSIERLFNIFEQANFYLCETRNKPAFEVYLVGATSRIALYGGCSIKPDFIMPVAPDANLVIIPSLAGDIAEAIKNNTIFNAWINEAFMKGSLVAGLCTGAFMMETVALGGNRQNNINWFTDVIFRKQFSQVSELAENLIMHEDAIESTRGAYSFIHGILERVAGYETAIHCSANFENEFNCECQSVVSISNTQPGMIFTYNTGGLNFKNTAVKMKKRSFASSFELQPARQEFFPSPAQQLVNQRNNKTLKQLFKKISSA